jgi:hypothetical protein
MADFPILALADLEYAEGVRYQWFLERTEGEWEAVQVTDGGEAGLPLLVPAQEDVGCRVKVLCTPFGNGAWSVTNPPTQPPDCRPAVLEHMLCLLCDVAGAAR